MIEVDFLSQWKLLAGDCLDVMLALPENSVDAVVTDPPYHLTNRTPDVKWCTECNRILGGRDGNPDSCPKCGSPLEYQRSQGGRGFMGKQWDGGDVAFRPETWAEIMRVLKPGGHVFAFGGTRTYHRLACAIEDAGFEIRDQFLWIYGCLDDKTEVATPSGVKPYYKNSVGDLVLCYDVSSGEYSYQPILEIVEYDYDDTAYRLVGDFGEQVVSRNHRCIVERGGDEVFQLAEEAARERSTSVPILENLCELQESLSDLYQGTGGTESRVLGGMRESANRGCNHRVESGRDAQWEIASDVRSMRDNVLAQYEMASADIDADVFEKMQWRDSRGGMGRSRPQGASELEREVRIGNRHSDDGGEQSVMEGRRYLPEAQGQLRRSVDQACPLSSSILGNGEAGWLRDRTPANRCYGDRAFPDESGVRSSPEPQGNRQPQDESDAVCDQWATQSIRAWRGHRSAVVRIVPFRHVGKVWCLRVPTGAFVAVRGGVAFPTGNSGFPKSLNVSKQIDKHGGQAIAWFGSWFRRWRDENGISQKEVAALFPSKSGGLTGCVANWELGFNMPTPDQFNLIRNTFSLPFDSLAAAEREVVGHSNNGLAGGSGEFVAGNEGSAGFRAEFDITAPATDAARQWEGWGTAAKPSHEPICLARKPLSEPTVAANVLRWGTGALNIDSCRIAHSEPIKAMKAQAGSDKVYGQSGRHEETTELKANGRWPANICHDGSPEVLTGFPETKAGGYPAVRNAGGGIGNDGHKGGMTGLNERSTDSGSAARFFYSAKASKADRAGSKHPTVKPVALMQWLVRLITPPCVEAWECVDCSNEQDDSARNCKACGRPLVKRIRRGVILDPFAGSGTTGAAALAEGFDCILIEREAEYLADIERRMQNCENASQPPKKPTRAKSAPAARRRQPREKPDVAPLPLFAAE